MSKASVKTVQAKGVDPVGAEIIAAAIVEVAAGMRALTSTRLKHETVVTLIHANSGISKREIRTVLANLSALETIFLKPRLGS